MSPFDVPSRMGPVAMSESFPKFQPTAVISCPLYLLGWKQMQDTQQFKCIKHLTNQQNIKCQNINTMIQQGPYKSVRSMEKCLGQE
jgi:hypothetical protein